MGRAVFLDRDGVINRAIVREGRPHSPGSLKEWQLLPGVAEALEGLRKAGFCIIVVTNQPNVSKGTLKREAIEEMHEKMRLTLPVDDIKVCFHIDSDGCSCRKPKPGMLLEAARERGLDLKASYMVGDRWRDIEAGKAAGCMTILIESDYVEQSADSPDAVVRSLSEAGTLIQSGWQSKTTNTR